MEENPELHRRVLVYQSRAKRLQVCGFLRVCGCWGVCVGTATCWLPVKGRAAAGVWVFACVWMLGGVHWHRRVLVYQSRAEPLQAPPRAGSPVKGRAAA
eukprot:355246-Chlamydomonas_euryale.AAC.8